MPGVGKPWTEEEDNLLRQLYPDHTIEEINPLFDRTHKAILARAHVLQLKKDPVWKRSRAEATMFKPGNKPFNKGKTWEETFSHEARAACMKTWFKKGQSPANTVPIGSERRTNGGYILVKVAEPNVWKQKHRILWEQHHGRIPKGMNIVFIDGNTDNITIENLRMESMKEKFLRCGYIHNIMTPELRYMCHLKGVLKRQITKTEKNDNKRRNAPTREDER